MAQTPCPEFDPKVHCVEEKVIDPPKAAASAPAPRNARLGQPAPNVLPKLALLLLLLPASQGCSALLVRPMIEPLSLSLQSQADLNLIREGTPSLLLLVDGLLAASPDDPRLLLAASQAYSFYASTMAELGEAERAGALSRKAKDYGFALLGRGTGAAVPSDPQDFARWLATIDRAGVPALFWGGSGWATWVRYQNGSPAALADLPRLEQLMLRVVELDEKYYYGAAHLFLGYYYGFRPALLGGDPEKSRLHFERALELGGRNFLLTQVAYAEIYARMTLNRELFQSLLQEVLNRPADRIRELTASNQLAKLRAQRLLAQADDFF